jgi:hypothetical protein
MGENIYTEAAKEQQLQRSNAKASEKLAGDQKNADPTYTT